MQPNSAQSSEHVSAIPSPPNIATPITVATSSSTRGSDLSINEGPPVSQAATGNFALETHEYICEYIKLADQKAIFYFSVCSTLLAFEHTQNWTAYWMKPLAAWSGIDVVYFLSMVTLAIAAVLFLMTVIPRLAGAPRGLIFFRSIANFESATDYVSVIKGKTDAELIDEKLRHCYELSKVADGKYRALSKGLYIGSFGIIASLILLLIS